MKAILRTIISPILCCSVIMTSGCASDTRSDSGLNSEPDIGSDTSETSEPDEGFSFAPISEIRENFSQTAKELRAKKFENMSFENAEFSFPEIDSISQLSLSEQNGLSPRELCDFYCDRLEYFLPGVYTDEEKHDLIKFSYWGGAAENGPVRMTIDEYELVYDGEKTAAVMVEANKCFLQGIMSSVEWFVYDDLNRWMGNDKKPFFWGLGYNINYSDKHHPVDYVTDLSCTDRYELINGEMSVKEAVDFVNSFLETTVFTPNEQDAKTRVIAVDVVDIGEGKYGYGFNTVFEYNGVLFDYSQLDGVERGHGIPNDYDKREYASEHGEVSMIRTDKVLHFVVPVFGCDIEETETYTDIITLQDTAEIVSDFYSEYMSFSVTKVEAVYLQYDGMAYPCWKFVMRSNGEVHNTLVDMQTGEVHLYIQVGD